MIKGKHISLVIPCRNEEIALMTVLKKLPRQIDEVIVVDNLSSDKTAEVARSFGATVISEARVEKGIGYGFALASGMNQSNGDIIACLDGDGSYPVREVPKVVRQLLKSETDFVSCNRSPVEDPKKRSRVRAIGVIILNLFIFLLFGYKIKDSLSGMWVFRRSVLSNLKLYEGGWDFSEEIKLEALTNPQVSFMEYSIPYQDRVFNQSKLNIFQAGLRYWLYIFKFKLMLRERSYLGYSKVCLIKA